MANTIVVLTLLLQGIMRQAGLTQQIIEIEPGTLMTIWVPKETVTKTYQNVVYIPPTKPAVLLLHSFDLNGLFNWFLQVPALTPEYAVYVPDFVFFGGSITDRNERSASFQAEFVAKGLEKLRVDKVTLVGLSYGGIVGFRMAKLYPNLVKSMVMSDTVIELTVSISLDAFKRLGVASWSDLFFPETVEGVKRLLFAVFNKVPWLHGLIYEDLLEALMRNKKERNELLVALVVPDKDARKVYNYSQEIYLLWGENDKIFPLDLAMTLKTQLGDKTSLESIKDAGHLSSLEQPLEYNKRLKRILESATKYH